MQCSVYSTVKRPGISQKKVSEIIEAIGKQLHISGDISVHFIGDKRMQTLNNMFRGKDRPTDVLSFAAQEEPFPVVDEEQDWGDVFISVPYIHRQAKRCGVTYKEEVCRMLIHGTLHALGYDHMTKSDADIMFPLQEKLLQQFL